MTCSSCIILSVTLLVCYFPAGSPRVSTPVKQQTKTEGDTSNLKTMPKGLSASLPDLDSESWIEVKKRPRPSPARPKASAEKVQLKSNQQAWRFRQAVRKCLQLFCSCEILECSHP